ncbi:hypothetical protein AB0C97_36770 [Streptomyces goshikiensis]|uniref:hypothetical protein n=1 Tax=Streptomyces goshikiensis TaxID=1942 RepID=UPI0033ED7453
MPDERKAGTGPAADEHQEHGQSKATFFRVPPALAAAADRIACSALDRPAHCPHTYAPLISATNPDTGAWCAGCGADDMAALLLDPACSLCRRPAADGVTALPAGEFSVLARLCQTCRTSGPVPATTHRRTP